MSKIYNSLQLSLFEREQKGIKRTLKVRSSGIDFYSNDYLGLAKNEILHQQILNEFIAQPSLLYGSTGARLISGNSDYLSEMEEMIANEHKVEAALLFSSGYNANLALFSALLTRHDIVLVDENIHRSVHDGIKLSNAKKLKFKHNDLDHLEKLLQRVEERCFIVVESLYSMDGDCAPLIELVELANKYNAALMVDEAHAFGVFGYGLVHQLGLQHKVFATVVTYGKAMGMSGASILANQLVIDYLINYASPFIYTTAIADFHVTGLRKSYQFIKENKSLQESLQYNISLFRNSGLTSSSNKNSPIQILKFESTNQLTKIKNQLEDAGINTFAVFRPTVVEGEECLRICLHAFNTQEEINQLIEKIKENV